MGPVEDKVATMRTEQMVDQRTRGPKMLIVLNNFSGNDLNVMNYNANL